MYVEMHLGPDLLCNNRSRKSSETSGHIVIPLHPNLLLCCARGRLSKLEAELAQLKSRGADARGALARQQGHMAEMQACLKFRIRFRAQGQGQGQGWYE